MVGVGESYLPAFVLALGMGEVVSGLTASVPMLIGSTLQLVSPYMVQKLNSYKKWVVTCAVIQALSFLPLIYTAVFGINSLMLILIATVLYWAGGLGTGAAWNSWMGYLVPAKLRTRYFSRRTPISHMGILIGLVLGASIAQRGKDENYALLAFAIMFFIAFLARSSSSICLTMKDEPKDPLKNHKFPSVFSVFKELVTSKDGKVLKYLLFVQMATHFSAPFFAPFMLKQIGLDYEKYMILVAAAFLARAMTLPFFGRIAHKFSATKILKLGGLLIIPLPSLWIISNDFIFLIFTQIIGGICWSIYELGMTISFFEDVKEEKRTSVLTCFSFANALAMAAGSLIGAKILSSLGTNLHAYFVIFVVSTSGRALALVFLRGLKDVKSGIRFIATRAFAVRPGMGAIERPILSMIQVMKKRKGH